MSEKDRPIKEGLPEFAGSPIVIGHELIDGNNHLNNKHYFGIWEAERVRFLVQECKINSAEIEEKFQIKLVVTAGSFNFRREVLENDQIIVNTSAENEKFRYLQFYQRMIRGNDEVAKLECAIFAVQNGHIVSIPQEIGKKIDTINSKNRK